MTSLSRLSPLLRRVLTQVETFANGGLRASLARPSRASRDEWELAATSEELRHLVSLDRGQASFRDYFRFYDAGRLTGVQDVSLTRWKLLDVLCDSPNSHRIQRLSVSTTNDRDRLRQVASAPFPNLKAFSLDCVDGGVDKAAELLEVTGLTKRISDLAFGPAPNSGRSCVGAWMAPQAIADVFGLWPNLPQSIVRLAAGGPDIGIEILRETDRVVACVYGFPRGDELQYLPNAVEHVRFELLAAAHPSWREASDTIVAGRGWTQETVVVPNRRHRWHLTT